MVAISIWISIGVPDRWIKTDGYNQGLILRWKIRDLIGIFDEDIAHNLLSVGITGHDCQSGLFFIRTEVDNGICHRLVVRFVKIVPVAERQIVNRKIIGYCFMQREYGDRTCLTDP